MAFHALGERVARAAPSTCTPTGRWCASTRSPSELLALSHVWRVAGRRPTTSSPPRARPRRSPTSATWTRPHAQAAALDAGAAPWPATGLRVLGVARAPLRRAPACPRRSTTSPSSSSGWSGSPIRCAPTVPAAVAECHAAGIRVVMITGDYPATARAIGRAVGLAAWTRSLTGAELDALDDAALGGAHRRVNVFARVVPEQKLRHRAGAQGRAARSWR